MFWSTDLTHLIGPICRPGYAGGARSWLFAILWVVKRTWISGPSSRLKPMDGSSDVE